MSTAALLDLQNRINTNTLTAAQQSILSSALSLIIPSFPVPDELGDSIPVSEEALARDWFAALYAASEGAGGSPVTLVNEILPSGPITSTPNPGTGNVTLGLKTPARAFGANTTPQTLSNAPIDLVNLTFDPFITGFMRVIVTGVVANSDSVAHPFVLQINGNIGAGDFGIQQLPTLLVPAGTTGFPFALVVDCDQANVPHVFALLTAGNLIASVTGVSGGFLSIPAQGLTMSVQELFG